MTPRREYGTGSVYQRASDGRWFGTFDAGWTAAGTRRRPTVSGPSCWPKSCTKRCGHEAAVRRKLERKRLEVEQGHAAVSSRTTVKAWADVWLPLEEKRLTPKAYNATRTAVRRWIVPAIGHRRLDQLTPADVRAVTEAFRRAGRSSSSAKRAHSALTSLLKAAMAEGHTVPQQVFAVRPPANAVSDRQDLTVEQAVAVLEQAAALPHGSRYVAALLQGMRQGECLGLTWDQVDLDQGALVLSWQLQALPYKVPRDRTSGFRVPDGHESRQLRGALHLVRPKSKAGWRVIPLVPWMSTALATWRAIAPASPHGLVWPNLDGGPTYYKTDDEEWYALQCTAEVGHPAGRYYGIHEARHTTATLLLEAGVDPVVITAILGHSSIVTSRGYMHSKTSSARVALEAVADRLQLTAPAGAP